MFDAPCVNRKPVAVFVLEVTWWAARRLFALARRLVRMLIRLCRRRTSHGSARWASWLRMLRARTWGSRQGIIVAKAWLGFIRYRGDGAVLVYAPMGSGKTSGLVLPALLDNSPRAIVCTDPKGECLAVAGRWRSTLGPVWRLDALNPATSHRLNPLDMIRTGTHHEADDAAMIADLLVISESSEAHWDSSAKQLITALIRHLINAYPKPGRTLATLRELIAAEGEALTGLFTAMAESSIPSVAEEGRITLASLGSLEMTSIIKNAAKCLAFWSKDRIGGMLTSASDFSFLNIHARTKTVFICVPEDKLTVYRPFLRMMMGCALAAAVRGKEYPNRKHKPLLLIDECPALGYLEALASGLGYLRAYAQTLLVFQDLGQLKRIYGEHGARTFMAASGCQVAFNVNDNDTARELADSIGMTTVLSRSEDTNDRESRTETRRYLMDPSEVRRLPLHRCLVLLTGLPPLLARKVRHYRERRWKGRWDTWPASAPPAYALGGCSTEGEGASYAPPTD
ncbi:type IV secretory system conjugative DNA transfer family protein [Pseudolabrys taiwanensis]|uniref:Type IV secretory system conjugative DNA transfer family protein n=1 Tax=Pseudolabrys taiwanensis TaxID=331696 RepID=A0A345ZRW5_9HYPH|nr:type IV secretory system conjugative DNA transfer family protein [Pseudolabrys taiwanensis]